MKRPTKIDQLKRVRALRKQRATLKRALASVDAKLRKQEKNRTAGNSAKTARAPAAESPRKRTSSRKKRGSGHYRLEIKLPSVEIQAGLESRRTIIAEELPLKARIHEALRAAGPNGLSLQELAAQLAVNYKHVAAWFATTGKKLPSIQKVGATTYRFAVP